MNPRAEVLKAFAEADAGTLRKESILQSADCDDIAASAALEGLYRENILVEQKSWGGPTFYQVAEDVSTADIEQAMQRYGATEAAQEIISRSSLLGEAEGEPGSADPAWEELL